MSIYGSNIDEPGFAFKHDWIFVFKENSNFDFGFEIFDFRFWNFGFGFENLDLRLAVLKIIAVIGDNFSIYPEIVAHRGSMWLWTRSKRARLGSNRSEKSGLNHIKCGSGRAQIDLIQWGWDERLSLTKEWLRWRSIHMKFLFWGFANSYFLALDALRLALDALRMA